MPKLRRRWTGEGSEVKKYTNPQIEKLIDDHIHNARDRRIMKLHYIDGLSADTISKLDENKKDVPTEIRIDIQPRRISEILSDRLLEIDEYL